MTPQFPTMPTNTPQPWQEHQISYGLKLLILLGFALLTLVAVTSGITLLLVLVSSATGGVQSTGNFWTDYFPLLLALGVFVATLYGAMLL